jgi:hypothetical protein
MTSNVDVHSRWVTALRTQAKTAESPSAEALPCPYCSGTRIFQSTNQLYDHTKLEHASILQAMDPAQARARVLEAAEKA